MTQVEDGAQRTKTALVTGGSRGIGEAVVRRLAADGWSVFFTYRSREDAAMALSESTGAHALRLDLEDADECARVVEEVFSACDQLDALINNAGFTIDTLLLRYKEGELERVVDGNLVGTMRMCRLVVRHMMKKRAGRIVNTSSVVGELGNAGQTAYAAAKAGVIGFTKALAREVAGRGVLVNCVSPGFIDTDMTREVPEAMIGKVLEQIPLGRVGTANDVAGSVAFLLSDDAAYVTGQVLRVNGGMYS